MDRVLLAVSSGNCIDWFFVGIFGEEVVFTRFFPQFWGPLPFLQNDNIKNSVEKMFVSS